MNGNRNDIINNFLNTFYNGLKNFKYDKTLKNDKTLQDAIHVLERIDVVAFHAYLSRDNVYKNLYAAVQNNTSFSLSLWHIFTWGSFARAMNNYQIESALRVYAYKLRDKDTNNLKVINNVDYEW